ncbi:hypothetical protein Mapa_017059 [Marchantia paleacea]|nr:hypothetical protein Mapa_017059 [Marchantia paleacea]
MLVLVELSRTTLCSHTRTAGGNMHSPQEFLSCALNVFHMIKIAVRCPDPGRFVVKLTEEREFITLKEHHSGSVSRR